MQPPENNMLTAVTNTLRPNNLQLEQHTGALVENKDNKMEWLVPDPEDDDIRTMASAQHSDNTLPVTKLQPGDLAPFGKGFCPIVALSKFPYKFVPASVKQEVASKFFDGGKFWMRDWDL
jgi:hypothetical protein